MTAKNKYHAWVFRIMIVALAVAASYHFIGIFFEINESSPRRHFVFVLVDLICLYGFVKRPAYFVFIFLAFMIQQYYSHGEYLVLLWINEGQVHWISVCVLILMPIGLWALVSEIIGRKNAAVLKHKSIPGK
jgi:hypothetical protein